MPLETMAEYNVQADLRRGLQQRQDKTQGPNWGRDKRLCPRLTAWIQNLLTFRSAVPPFNLQLEFLGFRLNIPWTGGRYLCIRMHVFRWDAYSKQYIFFSGMAKRVPA